MADRDDKTEAATGRQLQKAREGGNVAISRELGTLASLAVMGVCLMLMAPPAARTLAQRLTVFIAQVHTLDVSDRGVAALHSAIWDALRAALPLVLLAGGAGVALTLLQTRFLVTLSRLQPNFGRLNPAGGLKKIFGTRNLVELAKSLVKITVAGAVIWHVLSAALPNLQQATFWEPATLASRLVGQIWRVLVAILVLQALIAALDYVWVRYKHARDLRMSRFDVKQERKDTDGDPRIKRRLRQIRMMRARKRMRDGVKRATVIVTNPTHYAVALQYDRNGGGAPRVVAKGMDEMAARVREAAKEFGVPLVANPPLARALYKVNLDAEIPRDLYRAVAELIAYVWRLRSRGQPSRTTAI